MAVPTITLLNHTSLTTADASTGWFDTVTADADIRVEGTSSMSGVLRADAEVSYYDSTTAPITAAGKTVRGWFNTTNVPYLEIKANNGLELYVYDGTTIETKAIAGIDTYSGGWFNYIWDMDTFTTLTLANVHRWGVRQQLTASAKNVVNAWHDAIRYLDGYSMTGGTSGDKVRLPDIELYDRGTSATVLRGYGVITAVSGVYFCTGTVQFGTGATSHYFEMDGQILVFKDEAVRTGLYSLSGVGSGTNIVIKNSVMRSAGTTDNTRFIFDFDEANLAAFSCTDNLLVRASTCNFKTGQTVTGNTFDNCGQITPGDATMTDSTVKNYEGTADTAALIWSTATDTDGKLDNSSFTKGTAATHAIQIGDATTLGTAYTLRDISFSGYNASDGQTDSALYVPKTTGSVTINLIGCTGNIKYKSGGASVSIVSSPRTIKVSVNSTSGPIASANVYLAAASGGPFPYLAQLTTITRSGTTATVTHASAHGLTDNDKVLLAGITDKVEDNTVQTITVTGPTTYTYTTTDSGSTNYTGTKTSTFVFIKGLANSGTNSNEISLSRSIPSDQPVIGWARKTSTPPDYAPPNYKEGVISGTVSSSGDTTFSPVLISDD